MGVFWDLSLRAGNENDAEKINAYAKELNNIYKFELTDEVWALHRQGEG